MSRMNAHGGGVSGLAASAILGLLCLALVVGGAGCGGQQVGNGGTDGTSNGAPTSVTGPAQSSSTSTTVVSGGSTTTEPGGGTSDLELSVYLCGPDEKVWPVHRRVPYTTATGAAAVKALLEGPTATEKEAGLSTCVPAGTSFRGLALKDGVATLDLSADYASGGGSLSMGLRLAQMVFTLTQFPDVTAVRFQLDGEVVDAFGGEGIIIDHPMGRADFEASSPAILVESPAFGDTVSSPLRVWGTANVFEATFQLNIVDGDGKIVAEETVTATSGTGTRGTFDVTVPLAADTMGRGALIVFVYSAEDGSPQNVREIPITMK